MEIKFGGTVGDRQTAKLNSLPNFSAIRYILLFVRPLKIMALIEIIVISELLKLEKLHTQFIL